MKKTLLAILLSTSAGVVAAASYSLDPHHTNARFAADHHETSTNVGGFFLLEGKLQFDPAQKTGSVDIVIPLSKLNSGNPDFDQHLKTADFFNAEKFPEMRYVAWDVAITPDGPTFIEGNSFPSHAVPQFAAHYPDGIGILPEFRKFIDC